MAKILYIDTTNKKFHEVIKIIIQDITYTSRFSIKIEIYPYKAYKVSCTYNCHIN